MLTLFFAMLFFDVFLLFQFYIEKYFLLLQKTVGGGGGGTSAPPPPPPPPPPLLPAVSTAMVEQTMIRASNLALCWLSSCLLVSFEISNMAIILSIDPRTSEGVPKHKPVSFANGLRDAPSECWSSWYR